MSATEIILIVIGVAIFLLGYLMPARKKDLDEEVQLISEDEVRRLVAGEVDHVKDRIADIVDETINYSMEKAERAMERVANEKIMAVNEYSDTVLEEINKNHKEVVFLYDMLNDKHDNLMSTINEATMAADGIKQTVKDAEVTAKEMTDKIDNVMQAADEAVETIKDAEDSAMQAQKAAQDAMHSVVDAVEKTKSDLAAFQETKLRKAEVEEAPLRFAESEKQPENADGEWMDASALPDLGLGDTEDNPDDIVKEIWRGMQKEPVVTVEEEEQENQVEPENDFQPIAPKRVEIIHEPDGDYVAAQEDDVSTTAAFASMGFFAPKQEADEEPKKRLRGRKGAARNRAQENTPSVDIQFAQGRDNGGNSNERILALHKAGKSNMAIAKELGLGLGEVKLVIDLFEGM